jgi:hypothetical protein
MPTRRTPSFPVASAIFWGFFTAGNYIIIILVVWSVVRGPLAAEALAKAVGSARTNRSEGGGVW